MAKMTHEGIMRGSDRRTPENAAYRVQLRETAKFWVCEKGTKYRKTTGKVPGETWPMYRLDLSSVKELKK